MMDPPQDDPPMGIQSLPEAWGHDTVEKHVRLSATCHTATQGRMQRSGKESLTIMPIHEHSWGTVSLEPFSIHRRLGFSWQ